MKRCSAVELYRRKLLNYHALLLRFFYYLTVSDTRYPLNETIEALQPIRL
jgi:hypothetical protein